MNLFNFVNHFFGKKLDYNRATVSSIIRKIIVCDMECCDKIIYKIRNINFPFWKINIFIRSKKKYFTWLFMGRLFFFAIC